MKQQQQKNFRSPTNRHRIFPNNLTRNRSITPGDREKKKTSLEARVRDVVAQENFRSGDSRTGMNEVFGRLELMRRGGFLSPWNASCVTPRTPTRCVIGGITILRPRLENAPSVRSLNIAGALHKRRARQDAAASHAYIPLCAPSPPKVGRIGP